MKKYVKSSNDGSNPKKALQTRITLLKRIYDAMEELDATCFEELELMEPYEKIGDAIRENTYELQGIDMF